MAIIAALIVAVAGWLFLSVRSGQFMTVMLVTFCVIACFLGVVFCAIYLSWSGSGKKSKKTFDEGLKERHFQDISTFEPSNAYLAIDGVDGRIAYVSNHNPTEFQMAEVKDLQDIKTDMMKGPLGGATAVYFSFIYNGKKTKVHTFLSNQAYNLKSKEIMEGISKADMYVNLLNGLKATAMNA